MHEIAPNLSALIGEIVGARLILQAGSLVNLAKYPSSTVQILGAERALFRALKKQSKTPKHGIIYHTQFVAKAHKRNKGRVSRFVANKCSMAARIDAFMEGFTNAAFGSKLNSQVLERLRFYENGTKPVTNTAAVHNSR